MENDAVLDGAVEYVFPEAVIEFEVTADSEGFGEPDFEGETDPDDDGLLESSEEMLGDSDCSADEEPDKEALGDDEGPLELEDVWVFVEVVDGVRVIVTVGVTVGLGD